MNDLKYCLALLVAFAAMAGCRPLPSGGVAGGLVTSTPVKTSSIGTTTATQVNQATPPAAPVSSQPAAGICGQSEGPVVTFTIYADIPDPRCALVRPAQLLAVINRREETISVSLAGIQASIDPEGEYTFAVPLGLLLEKGVHSLVVEPCCGAELWLE